MVFIILLCFCLYIDRVHGIIIKRTKNKDIVVKNQWQSGQHEQATIILSTITCNELVCIFFPILISVQVLKQFSKDAEKIRHFDSFKTLWLWNFAEIIIVLFLTTFKCIRLHKKVTVFEKICHLDTLKCQWPLTFDPVTLKLCKNNHCIIPKNF